jgi:putative DNA primase/helicase
LWLVANDAPQVDSADDAMWRRIHALPFVHAFSPDQRNPWVKKLLKDPHLAGPAILAWLVEGWLQWRRTGLGTARVVEEATTAYKESMNVIGRFIEDRCVLDPKAHTRTSDLYAAYYEWAITNGELPVLSMKKLAPRYKKLGLESGKNKGFRGWWGVALKEGATWTLRGGHPANPSNRPALPPG